MVDTLALARDHMASQVADSAVFEAALAVAFEKGLDPMALDASFPTFLRTALAIITAGRTNSVQKAEQFYGAVKEGAGYDAALPLIEGPDFNLYEATTDLLVNGPVAVKTQLSNGSALFAALNAAKAQVMAVGKKHVLDAGRSHLINLSSKDKDALGWARVSDGQPCHFCAMLVGRGPVYSEQTAHFEAHKGCGCSVRPFFKGEADGGWSPDAKALNDLWKGVDENGNPLPGRDPEKTLTVAEWRNLYGKAVNDPSHPVFKTFTDKVAAQISAPAVVAARKAASKAWETQRSIQKAAEEKARAAQTAAEKAKADAEAKQAAKEAAKIKKWQGKPAPVKPIEPKPAATLGPAAFDQWLADVKKRYSDFAKATGNPKNDLTLSLNWHHVQKVVNSHDKASLDALKSMSYVDTKLYNDALAAMKAADAPVPGAAEVYKKELASYKRRLTTFKRNLADWREVNGITTELKGMDAARRFTSDSEGVQWANTNLHVAKGEERDAIETYTGSAYGPWNNALRTQADATKVPKGRYGTLTKKADKGFAPAPETFLVHRGTNWNEFAHPDGTRTQYLPPPPPESLIGTVQTQHGYMSTSVGTSAAFSSNPVQMKIVVPDGHGVSWAMPYSRFSHERELLMQRGTSVYIHDVYKGSRGQWIVEAEILPMDADLSAYAGIPPMPASSKF